MLKQSADLHSPVGVLYYDFYTSEKDIESYLAATKDNLQCIVGNTFIPFGYSQKPVITDFADNVNTLNFLLTL
jgi:hypothetical protein